jgi:hypothetical protein
VEEGAHPILLSDGSTVSPVNNEDNCLILSKI